MAAAVTVAVPVFNGARYLDEVLAAVRAQRVDREVEILVVDSGSTDGSRSIASRHGARVLEIPKAEFSHGGTRNRMMELSEGEHVAFLTQDATPAHDRWLASLLAGFEAAGDVALVFGPHEARPDASHMIKCEMERHFATFGDGGIDVQRLGRSAAEISQYRRFPGRWTFFSDVNGCVAKWAWRQVPYREVPYAEDQLLGREMIEAGFAKAYHPDARVLHSHDYPPAQFLRRYFDEFRSLREVLDHVEVAHPVRTPQTIRGLVGHDKRWLERRGVHGRGLMRPLSVSARHHAIRQAGAILGTRADRVPRPLRRALSLEGRDSFTPYDVPESPLLARTTQPDSLPVELAGDWPFAFAARGRPLGPVTTVPHGGDASAPWRLAWVVPPWRVGSGGHTTIFRLIRQLELRGHVCAIHVFDPFGRQSRAASELRAEVRQHFVPVEAEVFLGLEDFDSADVAIATEWTTAFPVRDLPRCREKAYLIQDHEPEFFATSSESIWAEETYAMGYRCIAYTPWMADVCATATASRRAGSSAARTSTSSPSPARRPPGGRDRRLRPPRDRPPRGRPRDGRARRARRAPAHDPAGPVRLAAAQQAAVRGRGPRRGPAAAARRALPLRASRDRLLAHDALAGGTRDDGLGAARGRAGGRQRGLGARGPRRAVELAPRTPDAIADALEHLLDDRGHAAAMAARARRFVEERTWERAGDQVEGALRPSSPRRVPSRPASAVRSVASRTPRSASRVRSPCRRGTSLQRRCRSPSWTFRP